jgi:hypothetical protein
MVVRFTSSNVISAYHHWSCEFEFRSCRGVLNTTVCKQRRSCKYHQQIGMQNNIRETYSTTQVKWKKGSTTREFGVRENVTYLLYTCSILLNILVIVNSHKLRPMIQNTNSRRVPLIGERTANLFTAPVFTLNFSEARIVSCPVFCRCCLVISHDGC